MHGRMKGLFTIGLAAALSFAACQFAPEPSDDAEAAPPKLTRAETLALMHLEDTHETGPEALKAKVNEFLTPSGGLRGAESPAVSMREVRKFTSVYQTGFASGPAGGRSADLEEAASEIPFYLFTLESGEEEQTGFALTCGDNRVGNVLAVVEKGVYDLEDEWVAMYDKILDAHVRNTIDIYNRVTGADIAAAVKKQQEIQRTASRYLSENSRTGILPAHLTAKTQWAQDYPFNMLINTVNGKPLSLIQAFDPSEAASLDGYKTGSVAVALAQIMAHHGKPQSPPAYITHQNGANQYNFIDPFNPNQLIAYSAIGRNGENAYNWLSLAYPLDGITGYPNAHALDLVIKKQIGVLFYAITRGLGIAYNSDAAKVIPYVSYNQVTNLLNTWGFSYIQGTPQNAEIGGSLQVNKPVFVYAKWVDAASNDGTSYGWVIDNYSSASGDSPTVYWHCNVGRSGAGNGWYLGTAFDVDGNAGHIYSCQVKYLTHIQ